MPIDINKLHKQPEVDFSDLTFGDRLKAVRKARGLTQSELAKKSGILQGQLSKYENNDHMPGIFLLECICKTLNISASTLLGF